MGSPTNVARTVDQPVEHYRKDCTRIQVWVIPRWVSHAQCDKSRGESGPVILVWQNASGSRWIDSVFAAILLSSFFRITGTFNPPPNNIREHRNRSHASRTRGFAYT
jgi:hypothetical protein